MVTAITTAGVASTHKFIEMTGRVAIAVASNHLTLGPVTRAQQEVHTCSITTMCGLSLT